MVTLSIVIPCFNEEKTLRTCVESVLEIGDKQLKLEILIVDDCSQDDSLEIAGELEKKYKEVRIFQLDRNQGKGKEEHRFFKG